MEVVSLALSLDGSTDTITDWLAENETATIRFMQSVATPTGAYLLIFYVPA